MCMLYRVALHKVAKEPECLHGFAFFQAIRFCCSLVRQVSDRHPFFSGLLAGRRRIADTQHAGPKRQAHPLEKSTDGA